MRAEATRRDRYELEEMIEPNTRRVIRMEYSLCVLYASMVCNIVIVFAWLVGLVKVGWLTP